MAKQVLDIAAMEEDFFSDKSFIGISCALPGYRFCWLLNQHFDVNFIREPEYDICIQTKQPVDIYFPIYHFQVPLSTTTHHIYTLKNGNEHLLPEAKQLDYIWMIQSPTLESDAEKINKELRQIQDIQLTQILNPEKMKSISYLLL